MVPVCSASRHRRGPSGRELRQRGVRLVPRTAWSSPSTIQEAAPESGIHTRRTRTPPPGSPWWTTEDNRFHHLPEGGAAPGDLRPGGLR